MSKLCTLALLLVALSGCSTRSDEAVATNKPKTTRASSTSDGQLDSTASSEDLPEVPEHSSIEKTPVPFEFGKQPEYVGTPAFFRVGIGIDLPVSFLVAVDIEAESAYLDLNQNGEFDLEDEKFTLVESTSIGKTRYWKVQLPTIQEGENEHTDFEIKIGLNSENEILADVTLNLWGVERSSTDAHMIPLQPARKLADVPLVHFDGPLSMAEYRTPTKLYRDQENKLYSFVGTLGEGIGTTTPIANTEIPESLHPVAEFVFQHKQKGEKPILVRSYLDVRC